MERFIISIGCLVVGVVIGVLLINVFYTTKPQYHGGNEGCVLDGDHWVCVDENGNP